MSTEPPTTPDAPLRMALRHETRAAHEDVEGRLDLLSPTLTPERYAWQLSLLRAFVVGWEAVPGIQPDELDWGPALWRGATLDREIGALASRFGFELSPPPAVTLPDGLGAWPGAVGSHYVLEGSALGARTIDAHLRAHFPWYDELGAPGYFASLAAVAGPRWRRFHAHLDEIAPHAHAAVVAAAVTTFEALAGHLRAQPARRR